jgi:FlaA1/EpsC-like NDP-sugar epimerase
MRTDRDKRETCLGRQEVVMRIVITGGNGSIGREIVLVLLARGHAPWWG